MVGQFCQIIIVWPDNSTNVSIHNTQELTWVYVVFTVGAQIGRTFCPNKFKVVSNII